MQHATGGRASGRFDMASPNFGIQAEQYSFVALSIGAFPDAKGQMDGKITRTTSFQELKRLVFNGVPQPTAGRYVLWQVQDNGEGANSPPDLATVLYVGFPQACLVYSGFDLSPLPDANIQVSQK